MGSEGFEPSTSGFPTAWWPYKTDALITQTLFLEGASKLSYEPTIYNYK